MARTIALTGAAGFIGSHLTRVLLEGGDTVVALVQPGSSTHRLHPLAQHKRLVVADTTPESLYSLFQSHHIDCVVHLAALYIKQHTTPAEAAALVESNVVFPTRLLDTMRAAGVRHIITTGTFFEYDTSGSLPLSETAPIKPYNVYAATKEAFATIVQNYVDQYDFSAVHLRLFAPYGPHDNEKLIFALIRACQQREPFEMTRGEQSWSYTYVEDIAAAYVRAIDFLLTQHPAYEVFNIGRSETVTLRTIAETIERLMGTKHTVTYTKPYAANEIMHAACDAGKAARLLGWQATTPLAVGLRRTIESFSFSTV